MSPKLLSGAARSAASSLLRAQSDERLAELAAAGHAAAFEAIVARHRPDLVRYCTRLVGPARAEDAVQQALLNAHTAMPTARVHNLRAWLHRVAHNAALNQLRGARDEAALDETLAAPGLQADLEVRDRLRAALAAIADLPAPQRDALVLHAVEGRSHEEVAAALGLSPGAARTAVHRARTTLRTAVTAVTPYGLLVRIASAGPWGEAGRLAPEVALTGGALVSVGKLGAAFVAAGAIAGGAATLPPLAHHGSARRGAHAGAGRGAAGEAGGVALPAAAAARLAAAVGAASAPVRGLSGHGRSGHSGPGHDQPGGGSDGGDRSGDALSSDDGSRSGGSGGGSSGSGDGSRDGTSGTGSSGTSGTSETSGSSGTGGSGTSGSGTSGSGSSSGGSGSSGTSGGSDGGTSGASGTDGGLSASTTSGSSGGETSGGSGTSGGGSDDGLALSGSTQRDSSGG